jgi:hypothetical protein
LLLLSAKGFRDLAGKTGSSCTTKGCAWSCHNLTASSATLSTAACLLPVDEASPPPPVLLLLLLLLLLVVVVVAVAGGMLPLPLLLLLLLLLLLGAVNSPSCSRYSSYHLVLALSLTS